MQPTLPQRQRSDGGNNETTATQLDEVTVKYERRSKKHNGTKLDHLKPVVPIISIDLPD